MILVTGGSGLLGKALIQALLKEEKPVRALVHQTPLEITHPLLEIYQGDILDITCLQNSLQGIDEVYHCAGLVSYIPGKDKQLYKINVEGTANLVNLALDAKVHKLIHVSSVAALNSGKRGTPIDEGEPWNEVSPDTPYGKSKYLGEMEVWRGMAEGLDVVVVNPSIIIGPGNWNEGSTAMFKKVYDGFNWFTLGATGYVGVDDVARAMIMLMNSDFKNNRYILSAENLSYKEVLSNISLAFGLTPPKRKLTAWMAACLWRIEWLRSKISGKDSLITKQTAEKAFEKVKYDNSKFLTAFPQFAYTPVKEAIFQTAKILQQKLNNH